LEETGWTDVSRNGQFGALTLKARAGASMGVAMSLTPDLDAQEALADTYRNVEAAMSARDWASEALVALGFAAVAIALFVLAPVSDLDPLPAVLSLALLVAATRVRFDTPFGYTVATQVAFVPLVFALPVALIAPTVAVAFALSSVFDVARGRSHPSRVLLAVGNSVFALGPAAVFALAGVAPDQAGLPLLLGALAAQFAVDFSVSSLRLVIAREADLSSLLSDGWIYAVDAALAGVGLAVAQDMTARPAIEIVIAPLLGLLALFARERRDRLHSLLELGNAYRGTALVLGDVVEADDSYTGEHCKSVVELSLSVGEELGLTATQRRNLEFGALLHDVGKVAIPKSIINKPGKLDPHEWTIIKTHTLEGQKMLDRVGGFMRDVGLIVRSHHERWDGAGYPDGLAGAAIPLEARIITCCDTWNAMRTDRPYRAALPVATALSELHANSGSQFDPKVVQALLAVIAPEVATADAAPAPRGATALDLEPQPLSA
jgi:putative nucleotidyltransferase with HDIG domain